MNIEVLWEKYSTRSGMSFKNFKSAIEEAEREGYNKGYEHLIDLYKKYYIDASWNLVDVVSKLCEATDILLHKKDYDGHGWEEMQLCLELGQKYITELKSVVKESLTTKKEGG